MNRNLWNFVKVQRCLKIIVILKYLSVFYEFYLNKAILEQAESESVNYNNNDQIRNYTDLNGTYISNNYDAAGRLTNRSIVPAAGMAGSTYESFDYDGLGRLISASNNDADVEFVYDGAGRQTGETVKWKDGSGPEETIVVTYNVNRDFDDNGNKTSLTYPSGKLLSMIPDPLDRLASVTSAGKNLVSYNYEGKVKITGKNLQNIVNMTSSFDDGRRPNTLNYTAINNQPVFAKTMNWNLVDLKKNDKEAGQGEEYTYDTGYRLRKVVDTKKDTQSEYQIDGVENIDSKKETKKGVTQTTNYTQNQRHQLTGYNGVPLTYDNNGNLTHYENQYVYNWRNQLVNVITGTGVNVSYKYDALGRRVEKKVSDPNGDDIVRYVYDGHQVVEERDGSGDIITRYSYGNGLDEPIEIEKDYDEDGALESYIPMQNTNGSVIGLVAGDGSLLEKIEYSDYGEPTFIYDEQAPQVDVVRTSSGNLFIRFSESIKTETANDSIKIKQGTSELTGSLTYQDEDRRVTFAPSSALPQAGTFAGGQYSEGTFQNGQIFYKGGDAAKPDGSYFFFKPPKSIAEVRIESAVKPQWIDSSTGVLKGKSPINSVISAKFPQGTKFYYGPTGYQEGIYVGGNTQIYVPNARKIGVFKVLEKLK